MKEIIEENAKQGNKEYENYMKKYKRKERTLTIFVGLFIVIATGLLMMLSSKLTDDAQKNCIEAGHSEAYCYEKL